ncbi:MAG: hypothetical protein JWP47_3176 [Polaromonas sp.]|nr:hypothetical protein [Polaromonas sp.]
MISTLSDTFQQAKAWDDQRESMPGEHWLTLAAGLALLLASNRSRSVLTRTLGSALGSALVLRAASGRDGIAKLLPYLPVAQKLLR